MQAVYGGKLSSEVKKIGIPSETPSDAKINISVDEKTGELTSILKNGEEILKAPVKINLLRYIDNDRNLIDDWKNKFGLNKLTEWISEYRKTDEGYFFKGVLAANCLKPVMSFEIEYAVKNGELEIGIDYELSDFAKSIPRVGLELRIDKKYCDFDYIGFGPYESYSDKHVACEYGYYSSSAQKNYDRNYVRPQESGSHYHTEYLSVKGLATVTATSPFSFSLNAYSTEQLVETLHDFELPKNDFAVLCLDLAMRGVGSFSCGPALDEKYEIPKKGKNKFKIIF